MQVKVVIAGCMWNNPHILVMDEPTNYLDRDSLGALAQAGNSRGGGGTSRLVVEQVVWWWWW